MWKYIAKLVNCTECNGTGAHQACIGMSPVGCSCDGTGNCPKCSGNGKYEQDVGMWPMTLQDAMEHMKEVDHGVSLRYPVGAAFAHASLPHTGTHGHEGIPPKRLHTGYKVAYTVKVCPTCPAENRTSFVTSTGLNEDLENPNNAYLEYGIPIRGVDPHGPVVHICRNCAKDPGAVAVAQHAATMGRDIQPL